MQLHYKSQKQHGNATTFIFIPEKPLSWIAGQSIKIEVPGAYGPLEHRFTISAAPYEQHVAITTRQSGSAYKKSLFGLQPGDAVRAFGLEGTFVWQENTLPKLFVAAGIGVTPFLAMLKQRAHDGQPLHTTLFYYARDNLFKNELEQLAAAHPEFMPRFFNRRFTAADIPNGYYTYLSGPSLMVDELSAELIARGFPADQLVHDWFTGNISV